MKTKQNLIEEYLILPVIAGDTVQVMGLGSSDKSKWGSTTAVIEVHEDDSISIKEHNSIRKVLKKSYRKCTFRIGYDPFPKKDWASDIRFISYSLDSILSSIGFERRAKKFKSETFGEIVIPELNWDPVIVNDQGEEIKFQRGFVWSLRENQLLIDSIYNNIEIGKIVIRKRSWDYVETRVNKNQIENTAFKDIIDGKQRLNAILSFVQDEYTDSNGYLYSQLSDAAQRRFENFTGVSYGEIGETATDNDIKSIFININYAGVPMSPEHIEFVKSINL